MTAEQGVKKRFCCATPKPDPKALQKLAKFVDQWLAKNLVPLSQTDIPTFEEWISLTAFPLWRKEELRVAYEELMLKGLRKKDRKVKSFIKREQYPTWKYARAINSRSDVFKVYCAPIFKAIEKKLFSMDYFIKKIPVQDRPAYIQEKVARSCAKIFGTDYTSFEALFNKQLMEACEMRLYRHMTKCTREGRNWYQTINKVLTGENACWFKDWFCVKTRARRMSGEMCTSLGNSFSNLMFMLYVCDEYGCDVRGVVEGDDGLFSVFPNKEGKVPGSEDFEKLGLIIKLEVHDSVETASFCGLIFDSEDLVNIREPLQCLADFAWIDGEFDQARRSKQLAMLRCKALSLAHQYPGCPIVAELAQYGLRVTRSVDIRSFIERTKHIDSYKRELLLESAFQNGCLKPVPIREVPFATRLLMAAKFNVSIEQQFEIESILKCKNDLSPLEFPNVEPPDEWFTNGLHYATTMPRKLWHSTDPIKWAPNQT
jgi:hypothetical protein